MKTKNVILFLAFIAFGGMTAQTSADSTESQDFNCSRELSIFAQSAKIKDYDAAKPHYEKLVENCPKKGLALFQYGQRMFEHYYKNSQTKADSLKYVKKLIANYENRLKYWPEKTDKGYTLSKIALLKYENKIGDKEEQFNAFDKAWQADSDSFNDPKSLYAYFSLLVDLQDACKKDLEDVFQKYNELTEKIQTEEAKHAEQMETLRKKKESGAELTDAEKRNMGNDEIYLKNYTLIKSSIDTKIGKRADCDNLVPLFAKKFEENKTNAKWLKLAASRLSAKKCTQDELFFKIADALQKVEPSAKTAKYLGQIALKNGKTTKAIDYFKQSVQLEDNNLDKAKVNYFIANMYKDQGRLSQARSYYQKVLKDNPSYGNAYLQIARMYAKSANNCGSDVFHKRAVYWLAANYADRAARVNPALKSSANQASASYRGRAPSTQDVFTSDYEVGDTINIGCWIGESIKIPSS